MTDTFTEVTTQSWFSRIRGALAGLLFGVIFFLGAFPALTWNEKRSIDRTRALQEVAALTTSIDPSRLEASAEGKAVHFSGMATTPDGVKDDTFGISEPVLKLKRIVEMFQWEEEKSSKTQEKMGGSSQTTTTYRYSKVWKDEVISSGDFKQAEDHQNPSEMLYPNRLVMAEQVTVGAYSLPALLVTKIGDWQEYPVPPTEKLPESVRQKAKPYGRYLYFGGNPDAPVIGDNRVSFEIVRPHDVTVIAGQKGNTLEAVVTSSGGEVALLEDGVHSPEVMFEIARNENQLATWLLRLLFFVLMAVGLALLFNPLKVLADVVPFVGSLVGAGTGIVAVLLAAALSSATIALAWLAFRPMIGIPLLVLTVVLFVVAGKRFQHGKSAKAQAATPDA